MINGRSKVVTEQPWQAGDSSLSSPYLPRPSLGLYSVTFLVTPIVSLLSLLYLFRLSYLVVFPRSTWNHGGLTFIVSDNLPTKKASGTLRGIRDGLPAQSVFGRVGGLVEDGHPPTTTVKAPSRREERKSRREPTTPRKSLFLIWDGDIGRWDERGREEGKDGREGLGLVPSSSFREELALRTSRYRTRKRRSSYIGVFSGVYTLDFGKSFRCNFERHFVSLFAESNTTSGWREQHGSLLRDLGIPPSRSP